MVCGGRFFISTDMPPARPLIATQPPQYQALLKSFAAIRSYRRLLDVQLVDAIKRDIAFAPGQPDFEREQQAQKIVDRVLTELAQMGSRAVAALLLFLLPMLLALALAPTPASAEPPYRPPEGSATNRIPPPTVCDDLTELAVVMQAEGGGQDEVTKIRMMQIILAEAAQRGLTVCALSRLTNFLAVRHYARTHPDSWTARQLAYARPESLRLAFDVIMGVYPDLRDGMMHFDGDGKHIIFRP